MKKVKIMIFKFSKKLYPKTVLIKSAYSFTDRAYIHLDQDNEYYIVDITYKDDASFDFQEFENEMLAQTARYEVYRQTKEIRKLTVARALASTVVDEEYQSDEETEDFDVTEILKDWFEKSE